MNIQIFSPHPDDVELFVGGTFLKHLNDGDRVQIVLMTHGEKGALLPFMQGERIKKMRRLETQKRMQMIKGADLVWLNFPDGNIAVTKVAEEEILLCMQKFNPQVIYLPEYDTSYSTRKHRDHLATGRLVYNAAKAFGPVKLRCYHSKLNNCFVDISPYHKENTKALRCYRSQYSWKADKPFLLVHMELMRFLKTKKWGIMNRCRFAEAFREQIL